ncbi:hypothetical protein [Nocardia abscessus]|uniref:hypothetical protein n=1 Tax=Nocardia abscessus TaxID=120957 RepID=UPI0024555E7C|nr:hypothetical protein [Nocardia abscessus]
MAGVRAERKRATRAHILDAAADLLAEQGSETAWITDVAALIRDCASGRELADGGFAQDVAVATELDVSSVVPVLTEGAFADAAG